MLSYISRPGGAGPPPHRSPQIPGPRERAGTGAFRPNGSRPVPLRSNRSLPTDHTLHGDPREELDQGSRRGKACNRGGRSASNGGAGRTTLAANLRANLAALWGPGAKPTPPSSIDADFGTPHFSRRAGP